jgi:hypothetical protein
MTPEERAASNESFVAQVMADPGLRDVDEVSIARKIARGNVVRAAQMLSEILTDSDGVWSEKVRYDAAKWTLERFLTKGGDDTEFLEELFGAISSPAPAEAA